MDIKAIETVYRGYHFRSRMEARWSVFFDSMKIDWRYEIEGFKFPDGIQYLPDFYLPKFKSWCEVKPCAFTDEERNKCKLLCAATKQQVIMLDDVPDFREYAFFEWYEDHKDFDMATHNEYSIKAGPQQYIELALISDWFDEDRFGYQMSYEDNADYYGEDYKAAVMASRAARFEFGQTPSFGRN